MIGLRRLGVAVVAVSLFSAFCGRTSPCAENGSRVSGTLVLADNGRFVFRTAGRDESTSNLEIVRFPALTPASPPVLLWHQVRLSNGDAIAAAVRKLDATTLHVRTSWIDSLAVPRAAVEGVANMPSTQPVFFDSFDGDLSAWTAAGTPRTVSGKLILNRTGQSVEAKLLSPLPAGRVAVGFHSSRTANRQIVLDLLFEHDRKTSPIRVDLIGPAEHFAIHSDTRAGRERRIPRTAGAHQIEIEFDSGRLAIFIDERVLLVRDQGPGKLRAIGFLAQGAGNEAAEIDAVLITRPERPREPRPWAALTADAVRSHDGDETFGEITDASAAWHRTDDQGQTSRPPVARGRRTHISARGGPGTRDRGGARSSSRSLH